MDQHAVADIARYLPDAVVVVDTEGQLAWANRAAERLFGTKAEAMVGMSTLPFVHPDDLELVLRSLVSIQQKDVGTPIEMRVRAFDGFRLVEVVGSNMTGHPGVDSVVLVLRDITERRRWEVARDEEGKFRALLHNAATVIMLLDIWGNVDSISAAVTRRLGHDQELLEGRPLAQIVAPSDHAALTELLDAVRSAEPGTTCTAELQFLHFDGSTVPMELHAVNLLDDPTVAGVVVSAHDVTELRRSLARLAEAQTELHHHERLASVGRLAAMIGHELRNPLTAVTNAHYLIRKRIGATGPELLRQLDMAEREIHRAVRLAEDLMGYVRPRKPEPTSLAVSTMVERVLEATPPPGGVAVEVEPTALRITADAGHLTEILANLVTNAYEAQPDGGRVAIRAHAEGAAACITVADEGLGLGSDAERIFEPFFSTKSHGTGLGLAIVRRLVEEQGGHVEMRPRQGGGTEALVWLPLAQSA